MAKKDDPWFRQEPFIHHPPSMVVNFSRPDFVILQQDDFEEYERTWTSEDIPILVSIVREKKFRDTNTQYNAIKALNKIKTGWKKEYIQQLITIFNWDDAGEELGDSILFLLAFIGIPAIKPLVEYITAMRGEAPRYGMSSAIESLNTIAEKHKLPKDIRDYLVEEFTKKLKIHKHNLKEHNSFIISLLVTLRAKESLDVIREAYLANSVEKDYGENYANILQALDVEIPHDDELITKCPHCQKPIEICQKEYNKIRVQKFQEAKSKNDIIGQLSYCEEFSENKYAIKVAKMYMKLNQFNDAKAYLATSWGKQEKSKALWEECCSKSVIPQAMPKRDFRIKSINSIKKNLKRKFQEKSLTAISSDYLVWVNNDTLHCMNIAENTTITVKLPPLKIKCLYIFNNIVATGGVQDFKVNLYDMKTGDLIETYEGLHAQVNSIIVTDKHVAATSHNEQLLWKRNSNSEPTRLLGVNNRFTKLATDGKTLMIGAEVAFEFDFDTGKYLGAYAGCQGVEIFSTKQCPVDYNDNYVAIGSTKELAVFHRGNRQRVFSIPLDTYWISLCGDVIAFVSGDIMQIWDVPTQTPLHTYNQLCSQIEAIKLRVDHDSVELTTALNTGEYSCASWNVTLQKVTEECFKCKKVTEKTKMCGRCGRAYYCSVECQKSDWAYHKTFCSKE